MVEIYKKEAVDRLLGGKAPLVDGRVPAENLPPGATVEPATTTTAGIVTLASPEDATAGVDTTKAVTPAGARAAGDGRYVRSINGTAADSSGDVAVPTIVVDPTSTAGLPDGTLIARTA